MEAFAAKNIKGDIVQLYMTKPASVPFPLTCIPVQVTEGWIPLGEMKEGGVVWTGQNPHGFPVGTKFYAEPPKEPK